MVRLIFSGLMVGGFGRVKLLMRKCCRGERQFRNGISRLICQRLQPWRVKRNRDYSLLTGQCMVRTKITRHVNVVFLKRNFHIHGKVALLWEIAGDLSRMNTIKLQYCLLYTSDAADEEDSV